MKYSVQYSFSYCPQIIERWFEDRLSAHYFFDRLPASVSAVMLYHDGGLTYSCFERR